MIPTLQSIGRLAASEQRAGRLYRWRPWLLAPEIYLLLAVAAFLRLWGLPTTEFDDDQATLFGLAYDAVHRGLLPVTSNTSSIGSMHPPGVVYLLMFPAALSTNPVGAALLIALLNILAVLLTYAFVRRYYGRLAATIAALLYATAATPLTYARFIWQPNAAAPFLVLFVWTLFRGTVDRRRGWLWMALLLLGVLYQAHELALLLIGPLLLAVLLAHETVRPRDLLLALGGLLVVLAPELLWLLASGFHDLQQLFSFSSAQAHWSAGALNFYRLFLIPYNAPPTNPDALLGQVRPLVSWLKLALPFLTVLAFLLAIALVLARMRPQPGLWRGAQQSGRLQGLRALRSSLASAWKGLRAQREICGLLILLTWQLFPLLVLSHSSSDLHAQYLLMLMPGPFILVGLLISRSIAWLLSQGGRWRWLARAGYLLAALLIIAQSIASLARVLDQSAGHFSDRSSEGYPYHNDLASLQKALALAEQLARLNHVGRLSIGMDDTTQAALLFLSRDISLPTTLFDAQSCLLLPETRTVMLVGPYDALARALLQHMARASLIAQSPRLGGPPFTLYLVDPLPQTAGNSAGALVFPGDLTARETQVQPLSLAGSNWLVTSWNLLRSAPAIVNQTYHYFFRASLSASPEQDLQSDCSFSALHAGDLLLTAFSLPSAAPAALPTTLTLNVWSYAYAPYDPDYGPLHLATASFRALGCRHLIATSGLASPVISINATTPLPVATTTPFPLIPHQLPSSCSLTGV